MVMLLMKLKNNSARKSIHLFDGRIINRDEFIEVDDTIKEIQSLITYRNDLEIKDIKEVKIKPKKKAVKKVEEKVKAVEKVTKGINEKVTESINEKVTETKIEEKVEKVSKSKSE